MTTYWYIFLAMLAGAVLPLQGSLNARLGGHLPHPMQATLVSYIGGTIACVAVLLLVQAKMPSIERVNGIGWTYYLGGFLGVVFVSGMLYLMPKIGAANMLAAAIVGQLLVSAVFDHYGLFGNPVIEVNPNRLLGLGLMFTGVYFLQKA